MVLDRDTCVEVLKIVIARIPSAEYCYAMNLNKLAIDSIFELCGDEELKRRFYKSDRREAADVFRTALDRLLDIEISDLFFEVAEAVYNYPEPVIN